MEIFFACFGIGSVLGILFFLLMLIPLSIYCFCLIAHVFYIYGSILFRGIDPITGKPPKTLEELKKAPQNP